MSISEASRPTTVPTPSTASASPLGTTGNIDGQNTAQIPTPGSILGRTTAYLSSAANSVLDWALGNSAQDMDLSGAGLFEPGDIPGGAGLGSPSAPDTAPVKAQAEALATGARQAATAGFAKGSVGDFLTKLRNSANGSVLHKKLANELAQTLGTIGRKPQLQKEFLDYGRKVYGQLNAEDAGKLYDALSRVEQNAFRKLFGANGGLNLVDTTDDTAPRKFAELSTKEMNALQNAFQKTLGNSPPRSPAAPETITVRTGNANAQPLSGTRETVDSGETELRTGQVPDAGNVQIAAILSKPSGAIHPQPAPGKVEVRDPSETLTPIQIETIDVPDLQFAITPSITDRIFVPSRPGEPKTSDPSTPLSEFNDSYGIDNVDVSLAPVSPSGPTSPSSSDLSALFQALARSTDSYRINNGIQFDTPEGAWLEGLANALDGIELGDGPDVAGETNGTLAESIRQTVTRQVSGDAELDDSDFFDLVDGRHVVNEERFHAFLDESLETIRSAARGDAPAGAAEDGEDAATAGPSATKEVQTTAAASDDPVDAILAEVGGAIRDYREKSADRLNPTQTLALEVLERTLLHRPEDDDGVPFDFATRAEGALDELQARYAKDYPPDTPRGEALGAAIGQLRDIISEDGLDLAEIAGNDIGGAINRLSGHVARVLGADGEMATRPLNTQWLAGKPGAGQTFKADALGASLDAWLGIQKSAAVGASGGGAATTEAGGAEAAGGSGASGELPNWEDPAFALFRERHDPPVTGFWAKLGKALRKLFGSRQAQWKNLQVANSGPNAPLDAVKCRNLDTVTINTFINKIGQEASLRNMSVPQYVDALRSQGAGR